MAWTLENPGSQPRAPHDTATIGVAWSEGNPTLRAVSPKRKEVVPSSKTHVHSYSVFCPKQILSPYLSNGMGEKKEVWILLYIYYVENKISMYPYLLYLI